MAEMNIKYNGICTVWEGSIRSSKNTGHLLKSELHLPDGNHVLLPYRTYFCKENNLLATSILKMWRNQ